MLHVETFFPYLWIAAAVFALIVETATSRLTAIFVMISALATLAVTLLGAPFWAQLLFFLLLSAGLLALRFTVLRDRLGERTAPDPLSLIGQTAEVTQTVDNNEGTGLVRVKSRVWRARSSSDRVTFQEGDRVILTDFEPDTERFTAEPIGQPNA